MAKSYKEIIASSSKNIGELRKEIPEVAKGFSALAGAAVADGALDKKTKELIALAIGIVSKCDPCIGFHMKALIELGVTRSEIAEVAGMCMYMGGGPAFMYAADALAAFDEMSGKKS